MDGVTRSRLETGHARLMATLSGTVQVTRCARLVRGRPRGRHRRRGPVIGKRQVEQTVVSAAADIAAFYAARVPVPCTASTLLVISADAKGIVMRPGALHPATAKAAARQGKMRTRLTAGEKPSRKRMATLACVYDAERPAPRNAHLALAVPYDRGKHQPCPRESVPAGTTRQ